MLSLKKKDKFMFQAIISVCNLINMECLLLKDTVGLINTRKECTVRAENMRKDFIDLYKGPVIIKKNCIKLNNFKNAQYIKLLKAILQNHLIKN